MAVTVYQMFKIILGLIVSGFVIYFLIFYTGTYSQTQEDVRKALIMKSFEKVVQDVYFTGNPYNFKDFATYEFETLSFELSQPEERGQLVTDIGKLTWYVPIFFAPGDDLFIGRGSFDLGWWDFGYAVALPETHFILNPVSMGNDTEESWGLVRDFVDGMPSSIGFHPKVTFGFCDGMQLLEDFCGSTRDQACEKEFFISAITQPDASFLKCTRTMEPGYVLITISDSCSPTYVTQGICIQPPSAGTGSAYIAGSTEEYMYHDSLDLVALAIGGDRSDIYGFAGENFWRYKNSEFASRVGLAARTVSQSADLMSRKILAEAGRGALSQDSSTYQCMALYNSLASDLEGVALILDDRGYYEDYGDVRDLEDKLEEAKATYLQLVNRGCEMP
jgi:hypothetical protein